MNEPEVVPEVRLCGVVLARQVPLTVREGSDELFLPLEWPAPTGALLWCEGPTQARPLAVVRTIEVVGGGETRPGNVVRWAEGISKQSAEPAPSRHLAAGTAAKVASSAVRTDGTEL